jgi:hypothetical protein
MHSLLPQLRQNPIFSIYLGSQRLVIRKLSTKLFPDPVRPRTSEVDRPSCAGRSEGAEDKLCSRETRVGTSPEHECLRRSSQQLQGRRGTAWSGDCFRPLRRECSAKTSPYIYLISKTRGKMCRVLVKIFFAGDCGGQRPRHGDSSSGSVVAGVRAALRSFASRRLMRCRRAFE